MKLPEDKNERNKVLGLIAVVVLALCYAVYIFGLKTIWLKQKNAQKEISDLSSKLWKADLDIKQTPLYMRQNSEVIDKIIDVSENRLDVLHPNLGNFLLVAEDIIERNADKLNLTVKSVTRKGEPPERFTEKNDAKKDSKAPRFAPFTVNVEIECSFVDLIALIESIEEQNPYLCITRIGIKSQPDNHLEHLISFDVQWPIWIDAKHPMKLLAEQMISKSKQ